MLTKAKNHIDFLIFYTAAKLEAESFRHRAGYFWWILDPLIGVGIYYFLFKVILERGGPDYMQNVFIGLVTWKWFADSFTKSSGALISNLGLMKKIRIEKHVFPTIEVLYNTWKFIVIFGIIMILYLLLGYPLTWHHLYLPALLGTQFVFIVGSSFLLASITPFLPDLQFFVTYFTRLMFYPSGVIFSLSMVPEKYQPLIIFNPMAGLIDGYRQVLMHGSAPSSFSLLYSLGLGIVAGGIGLLIMRAKDQEYPKLT